MLVAFHVFEKEAVTLISLVVKVKNETASLNSIQAQLGQGAHLHFAFLHTLFRVPRHCHYN